ncbi:MAG: hypothetical protein RSD62_03630 [Ruthenibacterium sp.]
MKQRLPGAWTKNDCTRRAFWLTALLLVALKLFLASRQMLFITPQGAPIDDTLMYDAAVSITNGAWLGGYDWLTLSKYMLFPTWVALLHTLHIPYLLGGQLLYAAACAVGTAAFSPVVRRYQTRLLLFFVLLFNPAQTAAAVQLRVYRDNITGALALLLFAGFAGAALRHKQPVRQSIGFLLAAGAGLAGSYLNREDGAWYLAFCVAATAVTCFFICANKGVPQKLRKCLAQSVPYAMLCAGALVFCALNASAYGRFAVSDFTSREFRDACGALMRVSASDTFAQKEKVPVSAAALDAVYAAVPEMDKVQGKLKSFDIMRDYGAIDSGGEYTAGGFYWALRRAVFESGCADTAAEAKAFYTAVADKINALCDSGALPGSGGKISTTLMPFRARYFLPTLREAGINVGRMLVFSEAAPAFDTISVTPPDLQAQYEAFLGNACNISAKPYTDEAYYLPKQQRAYFVFTALQGAYAVCVSVMFAAAVLWQAVGLFQLAHSAGTKTPWPPRVLWWVQLGLLCSVLLRCAIVAYLFVTAFNAGVGRLPYLCGAHPALLLFCFIGTLQCAKMRRAAHG